MSDQIAAIFQKYKRLIIWIFGTGVTTLIFFVLIIIPQILIMRKTDETISQTRNRIEFLNNKVKELNQIDSESYKSNLKVALVVLPQEQDIPKLVDEIQSLLTKSKMQLNGVVVQGLGGAGSPSQASSYQVKVDVVGDIDSLKNFINSLKSSPLVINLTGLDITASKGGLVEDNINLTSYWAPLPTSMGNIDEPVATLTGSDLELLKKLQQNTLSNPSFLSTKSPVSSSSPVSVNSSSTAKGKSNPFD